VYTWPSWRAAADSTATARDEHPSERCEVIGEDGFTLGSTQHPYIYISIYLSIYLYVYRQISLSLSLHIYGLAGVCIAGEPEVCTWASRSATADPAAATRDEHPAERREVVGEDRQQHIDELARSEKKSRL